MTFQRRTSFFSHISNSCKRLLQSFSFWTYPDIDPVALRLGPFQVRWYGLAYLAGIVLGFTLLRKEFKHRLAFHSDDFLNAMLYVMAGILIGGRLGYVLFYDLPYYLTRPGNILALWQGGMSYHGGAIGALIAFWLFSKVYKKDFWTAFDLLSVGSTIGIFFGRIANFINGELYGRPTSLPWGMVFPHAGPEPRHPSQLYEAFFEGIVLFIILWILLKKANLKPGQLAGVYLAGYGLIRFLLEFVRQPDAQLGFVIGSLTMGQLLSALMILIGITLIIIRGKSQSFKTRQL